MYLMLDLKWQGLASDSSPGNAHLIIYGVKEFQQDVESAVFDSPFSFNSEAMIMETDLDMNNHQIRNSNLKNSSICGVSRMRILEWYRIVALTAVRATI